jgi:predicted MFS family arabinose efflux permease
MTAPANEAVTPVGADVERLPALWRNRDFTFLWIGQTLSDLGGRVSGIAFPLLVLALTGSPAKAGLVGAAGALPLFVLTLPAGALVDRWDRKRVLVTVDAARCVALASVVVALHLDSLSFTQILVVAAIDGTGFVFFGVAERSALPSVVRDAHLERALAANQGRDYAATLGGTPLGGALYSLGRLTPFLFDAISYLVSVVTLLLIRTSFRVEAGPPPGTKLASEMRQGLRWFWRQPFIRTSALLAVGTDFVLNGLYLVVIVIARERGASPALVGAMFFFLGLGGIAGSFAVPWLMNHVSPRTVVVGTPAVVMLLLPLLSILPGRITAGVIYGAMFVPFPVWNAVVVSTRLRLTPATMQGRVASIATMFSLGPVFCASLLAGLLLQLGGTTTTVLVLCGIMVAVTASALASRSIAAVASAV